ncbi:MAG TPA: ABC transporter permease [Chitinophagaceae bacterium]|nr:ABC transporter permease [Chitinophagaceae bacterium]
MIKNLLLIAWRNMSRNKVNSVIHISGLAIGIAAVVFIFFFVQDELKYDRFFTRADHIFQVNTVGIDNGQEFTTGNTGAAIGPTMHDEFPEVETYARIYRPGDLMVRYEEGSRGVKYFTERRLWGVDSNFLEIFDYKVIEGDAATCLTRPDAVVITRQVAKKYFGNSSAIGKTLLFDSERRPFTVSCVLDDIPPQSSLQFDMLVPISTYDNVKRRSWNWMWLQITTYIKLKEHVPVDKASMAKLEAKLPAIVKKYAFRRNVITYEDFVKQGRKLEYRLQPLTSVHLYSQGIGSRLTTLGNIKYVYIFSAIALFIIILACVNFMNLSTAQAAKRAKEIGIRKVLGSGKSQLVKQFLAEALLYSFIASILALILVALLLKPFNEIAGKSFELDLLFSGYIMLFLFLLFALTGLLAGSYPAFYLTSFKPVAVLKGMKLFSGGMGARLIRSGLIVFQFTISIGLIVCTIVVFRQLRFTQNKNLGLDKENVIIIANTDRIGNQQAFRQELTRMNWVVNASVTSSIPTRVNFGDQYIPEPMDDDKDIIKEIGLSSFVVDDDFVPTLGIQISKGRNFSKAFNDSASVILNEAAIRQIGWKNPVGKYLDYPGNSQKFKVIGVAKDFNIQSLRTMVEPFALFHATSQTYDLGIAYVAVRVKPGDISAYLSRLENTWKQFAPNTPFDYSFLDSEFASLYQSEQRLGTVFTVFTILSIFIACLGLFGLAAYTAERRVKEIGVRKLLGASVNSLVALLSKEFVKLVIISAFIAFPLAGWAMYQWLQDFAYRISLGWWVFLVSGLVALVIAVATVSVQALKAASANPVNSLRTE